MMNELSNNCVQATPDFALLFIVAQVSAAPDAERWASHGSIITILPSNGI